MTITDKADNLGTLGPSINSPRLYYLDLQKLHCHSQHHLIPVSVVTQKAQSSYNMDLISSQPASPLTKLPLEIRRQIYQDVFADATMVIMGSGAAEICGGCGIFMVDLDVQCCGEKKPLRGCHWPTNYDLLTTCSAMYDEAGAYLLSELTVKIRCSDSEGMDVMTDFCEDHRFLKLVAAHAEYVWTDNHWEDYVLRLHSRFPAAETLDMGFFWRPLPDWGPSIKHVYTNMKIPDYDQAITLWIEKILATTPKDLKAVADYIRGKVNLLVQYMGLFDNESYVCKVSPDVDDIPNIESSYSYTIWLMGRLSLKTAATVAKAMSGPVLQTSQRLSNIHVKNMGDHQ